MKHEEKQKQLEALREQLKDSKTLILSAFEGLKVSQDVELRRKMRSAGASYKVVKNSLLERAAKGTPAEPVAQDLRGTTSVARTEGDPVALAKLIVAYAKEHPAFTFKAGIVEGRAHIARIAETNCEHSFQGGALCPDRGGRRSHIATHAVGGERPFPADLPSWFRKRKRSRNFSLEARLDPLKTNLEIIQ